MTVDDPPAFARRIRDACSGTRGGIHTAHANMSAAATAVRSPTLGRESRRMTPLPATGGEARRVLIANRGEIAVRIARAAREAGLVPLGIYSEADAEAIHLQAMDDAVCIGPAEAAYSYLSAERILAAARELRARRRASGLRLPLGAGRVRASGARRGSFVHRPFPRKPSPRWATKVKPSAACAPAAYPSFRATTAANASSPFCWRRQSASARRY